MCHCWNRLRQYIRACFRIEAKQEMVEYMSALMVVKMLCLSPVVVPNKRGRLP